MMREQPFTVHADFMLPDDVTVWTKTGFELLLALAIQVRMLAVVQVRRLEKLTGDRKHAIEDLSQLREAGLVERYLVNAHPLLGPSSPLFQWAPGEADPNSRLLSNKAKRRWTQTAVPTEVIVATKKTANLFAGTCYGLPPVEHRDHDLLLSDAYVVHRLRRHAKRFWIGEDFLPKAGLRIKDPDAFLVDENGHPKWIVESAGRYSSRQIESFHDYCVSLDLPYELW